MLSRQADREPVKRSGAKVGDHICVSGSLGGSSSGKHLEFVPRVAEAMKIAQRVNVHAMIDISDGLSSDLNRICKASQVGAIIDAEQIPISDQALKNDDPLHSALNDGEDFELLFTLAQNDCRELLNCWSEPVSITRIGEITEAKNVTIRLLDGQIRDLRAEGYDHLKN